MINAIAQRISLTESILPRDVVADIEVNEIQVVAGLINAGDDLDWLLAIQFVVRVQYLDHNPIAEAQFAQRHMEIHHDSVAIHFDAGIEERFDLVGRYDAVVVDCRHRSVGIVGQQHRLQQVFTGHAISVLSVDYRNCASMVTQTEPLNSTTSICCPWKLSQGRVAH